MCVCVCVCRPMAHNPREPPLHGLADKDTPTAPARLLESSGSPRRAFTASVHLSQPRGQRAGVTILLRPWPLPEASDEGVSGSTAWSLGHRPQAESPGHRLPSSSSMALVMLLNPSAA